MVYDWMDGRYSSKGCKFITMVSDWIGEITVKDRMDARFTDPFIVLDWMDGKVNYPIMLKDYMYGRLLIQSG